MDNPKMAAINDFARTILAAWRTKNRVTVFLISCIPTAVWDARVPGAPRKTIRMLAGHLQWTKRALEWRAPRGFPILREERARPMRRCDLFMPRLRVLSFAVSIDGYGAGPNQDLQNPLGIRGPELMEWFFQSRVWRRMHGQDGGETGIDDGIAEQGFAGVGAWILGRNMFGPVRGPWPDDSWKGWWGDEPPYHTPVFVLTHHPRPPLKMAGGTEFRFVTEGIHAALEQAAAAADGRDVRLGGGVSTIRQYLRARLIDELHLAVRPILLGSGEHLFCDIDIPALGYECAKSVAGERATHVYLRKRA